MVNILHKKYQIGETLVFLSRVNDRSENERFNGNDKLYQIGKDLFLLRVHGGSLNNLLNSED